VGYRFTAQNKWTFDIGRLDLAPKGDGGLEESGPGEDSGVIHQRVESAVGFDGLGDQSNAIGFLSYVGLDEATFATGGADVAHGFFAALGVPIGDDDLGAFESQQLGDSPTDARAGPGDDGNFTGDPRAARTPDEMSFASHGDSPRSLLIGSRPRIAIQAAVGKRRRG